MTLTSSQRKQLIQKACTYLHDTTNTTTASGGSPLIGDVMSKIVGDTSGTSGTFIKSSLSYTSSSSTTGRGEVKNGNFKFSLTENFDTATLSQDQKNDQYYFPVGFSSLAFIYNIPQVFNTKYETTYDITIPTRAAREMNKHPLILTPEIIIGIFKGTITKWDDAKLVSENPNLIIKIKVGDNIEDVNVLTLLYVKTIKVAYRASGSGDTALLTNYLHKFDNTIVDSNKDLVAACGGSGSFAPISASFVTGPDLLDYVSVNNNTFGYCNSNVLNSHSASIARLKNKNGNIVSLNDKSVNEAILNTLNNLDQNSTAFTNYLSITNPLSITTNCDGQFSYPILQLTYGFVLKSKVTTPALYYCIYLTQRAKSINNSNFAKLGQDYMQYNGFYSLPGYITEIVLNQIYTNFNMTL
jgi:ABC-type phosphate transport system substrate-binding protein